jgi:hypothetical protein
VGPCQHLEVSSPGNDRTDRNVAFLDLCDLTVPIISTWDTGEHCTVEGFFAGSCSRSIIPILDPWRTQYSITVCLVIFFLLMIDPCQKCKVTHANIGKNAVDPDITAHVKLGVTLFVGCMEYYFLDFSVFGRSILFQFQKVGRDSAAPCCML